MKIFILIPKSFLKSEKREEQSRFFHSLSWATGPAYQAYAGAPAGAFKHGAIENISGAVGCQATAEQGYLRAVANQISSYGLKRLDPQVLTEIILGCKIIEPHKQQILQWVSEL